MPKGRRFETFPVEWMELVALVNTEGKSVVMEFTSSTEAHNFRKKFYDFKRALRELPESEATPAIADNRVFAEDTLCQMQEIPGGGVNLIFLPRSSGKEGSALRKALDKARGQE